jgi:hypothetical protein
MCKFTAAMSKDLLLVLFLPSFMLTLFVKTMDFNSDFCRNFITLLLNFIFHICTKLEYSVNLFSRGLCVRHLLYRK